MPKKDRLARQVTKKCHKMHREYLGMWSGWIEHEVNEEDWEFPHYKFTTCSSSNLGEDVNFISFSPSYFGVTICTERLIMCRAQNKYRGNHQVAKACKEKDHRPYLQLYIHSNLSAYLFLSSIGDKVIGDALELFIVLWLDKEGRFFLFNYNPKSAQSK